MKQHARGIRGFTLVELLVVIGIIALLISILLPSLSKARKAATAVACASNMRNIGQFFHIYMDSNRGNLPIAMVYSPVSNYNYYADIWPYAINYAPRVPDNVVAASPNSPLDLNIANKNIWHCPFYQNLPGPDGPVNKSYVLCGSTFYDTLGNAYGRGSTYGKLNEVFGDRSQPSPQSKTVMMTRQLRVPARILGAETVMMTEIPPTAKPTWAGGNAMEIGDGPYGTMDFYDWFYCNGPYAHNFMNSNYLFLDGHVSAVTPPIKYAVGNSFWSLFTINGYQFSRMFSVDKTQSCLADMQN
jgi:prepilin-type N-terminal cleavage/methylation domain-containing protein/prepilin-type processing-associated H-X9-DG protein